MARDGQFDETVSRWLEETAPAWIPERVLEATFERTRRSRQHRGWRARLGRVEMLRFVPALGSAGVLVAAAVIASALIPKFPPSPAASPAGPSVATTPSIVPPEIGRGLIAFAADASAGDTLTDPVDFARVETRPEPMDIYVTREGEPTRRLIATDAHERCPVFSPDGQRLAYLEVPASDGSLAPSIVVVQLNAAGAPSASEMRVLLPAAEVYRVKLNIGVPCPRWSPDGNQIAYLAYPTDPQQSFPNDVAELRVSTLDGQESVLNSERPSYADGPFAWSPDGDAIAYTAADGVWSAPLDGSAPSLVWRPDGKPIAVSWSSRGELAVTVLTEVAVEGGSRDDLSVHVVDVGSGSERSLDMIHTYDYGAAWSPDGSRLALVGDNAHVLLSNRDDGSTATLSPRHEDGRGMLFWDVGWSPDGERLLALTRSDIGFALVSLSTDGASADVLTPWTFAMDWINIEDVSWQPTTN